MNFSFLHLPAKDREHPPDTVRPVAGYGRPYNTTEGSEFLDDAIRTREQALPLHHETRPPEHLHIYCSAL